MFLAQHPHDDRLFDCYMTSRHGEAADPRVAEHLVDCAACASRYAELSAFMDETASEGAAESDEIFTADHLRAQQSHILRRIEHVGRPARVISFPRHNATERMMPAAHLAPSRWIAGAAAAGLFVGVAMGAMLGWRSSRDDASTTMAAAAPALRVTPAQTQPPSISSDTAEVTEAVRDAGNPDDSSAKPNRDVTADDVFLSELEGALERTQTRELGAIDALTPHVRPVPQQVSQVSYVR